MSQTASNIFALFKYLPVLATLISSVEVAFGPKNGTAKKKAVVDAFTLIITQAAPFISTANPAYAKIIGDTIDFLVTQLNEYANLSDPVPDVPTIAKTSLPGH